MTDDSDDRRVVVLLPAVDRPEAIVLRLAGEIDVASLPPIELAIDAATAADVGEVVIDLTDVRFMGVSAVNAFVRAADEARRRRKRLRLTGAAPQLRELFELLAVDSVLAVGGRPCR